ncbi:MAG: glycosyltransferase family 4 protein [bacterium]|nr:glycosyltransferase family 4 protein [bacterium]
MRILLTCHVRFASAMAWYTFHLARGLLKQGHDVWLSAKKDSPLAEWASREKIPGSHCRDYRSGSPTELWRSYRELTQTIREFKPDILNPHCPPGHTLLALANRGKLPLIRTVADPRPPKSHFVNRYLHERKTSGMIYSTASSLLRYDSVFNFTHTEEKVILPGLDLSLFPLVESGSLREKFNVPEDALFAAIVARMSPEKGQELLIEALALLAEETRRKIVVLLTGDDSKERRASDLEAHARSKGVLNSLRFADRQSDVRPLLNEIDLGIITSTRSEAVCRIALEFMAYKKPIISTDINILPEVVRNGVNGWCVSTTDPRAFANSLEDAVRNRAMLSRLGQQGHELLLNEFTVDKMTESTTSFYKRIIERNERAS